MGTSSLDREIKLLRQERLAIMQELRDAYQQPLSTENDAEIDSLYSRMRQLGEEISDKQSYYQRPNGLVNGLFSRVLPPLPSGMKTMEIDDEAEKVMKSLPSYRLAGFGLFAAVLIPLALLYSSFPWLTFGPLWLLRNNPEGDGSNTTRIIFIVVFAALLALVFWLRWSASIGPVKLLQMAALSEEQWFRSGAESWTTRQRIVSCLSFGLCHIVNIIMPLLTLLFLGVAGAGFMVAYLREYRRSGDTYRATLASTKLHAQYNVYAFSWFGFVVIMSIIASFL